MDADSQKAIALKLLHAGDVGDAETTHTDDFTVQFTQKAYNYAWRMKFSGDKVSRTMRTTCGSNREPS